MISERDLRLAKAIVDPYIGRDIIATAVLGTKLGTMLNENAYITRRLTKSVKCGAFGTYDPLATLADGLFSTLLRREYVAGKASGHSSIPSMA